MRNPVVGVNGMQYNCVDINTLTILDRHPWDALMSIPWLYSNHTTSGNNCILVLGYWGGVDGIQDNVYLNI